MKKSNLITSNGLFIDENFLESAGLDGHGYSAVCGEVREPRDSIHYKNGFSDGNNFIVVVEKCGLMSIQHTTIYYHENRIGGGWHDSNLLEEPNVSTVHMVVRDPVERWIAGMAEHITHYYYLNDVARIDPHDWADYKQPWYYDCHIVSLSTFAHGLSTDTMFWKLENLQNLFDYCGLGQGVHLNPRSSDKRGDRQLKLQISEMLRKEADLEWVKDFYASDYKLLELAR